MWERVQYLCWVVSAIAAVVFAITAISNGGVTRVPAIAVSVASFAYTVGMYLYWWRKSKRTRNKA
jgi:predicted membrane channel-forming protein YqfA (hemolysin III family)